MRDYSQVPINLTQVDDNEAIQEVARYHFKIYNDTKKASPRYALKHQLLFIWLSELYERRTGSSISYPLENMI